MNNKKLKEYIRFKGNPELVLFQALEKIRKKNKEDVESIKEELLRIIEKKIRVIASEVKPRVMGM